MKQRNWVADTKLAIVMGISKRRSLWQILYCALSGIDTLKVLLTSPLVIPTLSLSNYDFPPDLYHLYLEKWTPS